MSKITICDGNPVGLLELFITNPTFIANPQLLSVSPYTSIYIGKQEALQIEIKINKSDRNGKKGWTPIGDSLYNYYIGKSVERIDIVNAPNSLELQNLIFDMNSISIPPSNDDSC